MKLLLEKLGVSIEHLKCLDETFAESNLEYHRIETILNSEEFREIYYDISKELYAGGKKIRGHNKLARQMILGDVIEYIFTGRAYYYAAKSNENLQNFWKLLFYCVNQLLLFDTITVDPDMRRIYLEKLESKIDLEVLYEKEGDREFATALKNSRVVIWTNEWTDQIDSFIDSILPKTLGCPKELIVFAELIRLKKGIMIPLLLIQRIFGGKDPIAPPDFLIIKPNKDIFGIEVGFKKELQSREFSIRTSIPTFAVDLKNNMHNRCPKCGHNILYCDMVINAYTDGTLNERIEAGGGKFLCRDCPNFNNGHCTFSNYYGLVEGEAFTGEALEKANRHYHTACIKDHHYIYRRNDVTILATHLNDFFAQVPEIAGIENL